MLSRISVWLQYLLPKQALTELAGRWASREAGGATTSVIRWFVGRYGVDMREAAEPDLTRYPTFNAFFTRPLTPGARPIAGADFVCPVDGAISQCGPIAGDQLFQAKGHTYSTATLLAGDSAAAPAYTNGTFATIYLSPRDYHRIHMPCAGRLRCMRYVPGDLFSVNPATARGIPGLFARNERVVCEFDGEHGPFVVVLVGATIVGSMSTIWHGVVNPPRTGKVQEWHYADGDVTLAKGDEMGRFLVGSTVVLLFPAGACQLHNTWSPGKPVRMGERMGEQMGEQP